MNYVYFDEAGNTGHDLLNQDQPVFVLAANNFNELQAESLLRGFKIQKGAEAKFKNLKKSPSGQRKIIDFINELVASSDNVKTLVIHKKYMVLGKILDILVEPVYFKNGLNFNANAHNISSTNMYWYLIQTYYGEDALNQILEKFIILIKDKTQQNIKEFYDVVRKVKNNPLHIGHGLEFEDILDSESIANESLEIINKQHLDPVQCGLFTQSVYWGRHFQNNFTVIHDESNSLEASLDYFNQFTDSKTIPFNVGNDFRSFELPLRSESVIFEDSKKIPQIQVSDLIAGSVSHFAKSRATNNEDEFSNALQNAGIEKLITHSLWHDQKVTPEHHGITELQPYELSKNPVDEIASYLLINNKFETLK